MGPEKKKGFADRFSEAFEKSMREEHEDFEKMSPKHKPGEGVFEVLEPEGETHHEVDE